MRTVNNLVSNFQNESPRRVDEIHHPKCLTCELVASEPNGLQVTHRPELLRDGSCTREHRGIRKDIVVGVPEAGYSHFIPHYTLNACLLLGSLKNPIPPEMRKR